MTYELEFHKLALKEWKKLNPNVREQLKKKLKERLQQPRVPASQLSGMKDVYKIKLRQSGYRLVYKVIEERVVVQVISVGKREKNSVYDLAFSRREP